MRPRTRASGPDGRDDDLPEELNRRVDQLIKIREAREALEEEARRVAAEKAAEQADTQGLDEQAKHARVDAAASKAAPLDNGSGSGPTRVPTQTLDRISPAAEVDRRWRDLGIGVYILFTWVHHSEQRSNRLIPKRVHRELERGVERVRAVDPDFRDEPDHDRLAARDRRAVVEALGEQP